MRTRVHFLCRLSRAARDKPGSHVSEWWPEKEGKKGRGKKQEIKLSSRLPHKGFENPFYLDHRPGFWNYNIPTLEKRENVRQHPLQKYFRTRWVSISPPPTPVLTLLHPYLVGERIKEKKNYFFFSSQTERLLRKMTCQVGIEALKK